MLEPRVGIESGSHDKCSRNGCRKEGLTGNASIERNDNIRLWGNDDEKDRHVDRRRQWNVNETGDQT